MLHYVLSPLFDVTRVFEPITRNNKHVSSRYSLSRLIIHCHSIKCDFWDNSALTLTSMKCLFMRPKSATRQSLSADITRMCIASYSSVVLLLNDLWFDSKHFKRCRRPERKVSKCVHQSISEHVGVLITLNCV